MTEARLIQVVATIVFILVVVALTAITGRILEAWKETEPPPPHKHVVNWCGRNGHRYMRQDGLWLCAHCGDVVGSAELGDQGIGPSTIEVDRMRAAPRSAELGDQGKTGRAA